MFFSGYRMILYRDGRPPSPARGGPGPDRGGGLRRSGGPDHHDRPAPEPRRRCGPDPGPVHDGKVEGYAMAVGTDGGDDSPRAQSFLNDIEFHCEPTDGTGMVGELLARPGVLVPGTRLVRPAVLATVADVMAGLPTANALAPRLPLTLDIDVRTVGPAGERLWLASRLLKVGRTTVAAEVAFTDGPGGPLVALSYLTFVASPRPQDTTPYEIAGMRTTGSLPVPMADHVGARVVAPGMVEIDRRPFVIQASGTLQGGIVALLGELAAESLVGRPVLDLDTRYLATIRVGPARAEATAVGGAHVRVEVRDTGNGDRLAARIMARMVPGPPPDDGR